jgi:hypothetical protein
MPKSAPFLVRLDTTFDSPEAKRYLEALSTTIFYGSLDGDVLTVKGFVSVR